MVSRLPVLLVYAKHCNNGGHLLVARKQKGRKERGRERKGRKRGARGKEIRRSKQEKRGEKRRDGKGREGNERIRKKKEGEEKGRKGKQQVTSECTLNDHFLQLDPHIKLSRTSQNSATHWEPAFTRRTFGKNTSYTNHNFVS